MQRPDPNEYNSYYGLYINQVPDGDILETLRRGVQETVSLLSGLAPEKAGYRYAEGKWSINEVLCHIIDTERVFAYRGMCIARGETANLPEMDQDVYSDNAMVDQRSVRSLLDELEAVRGATVTLFAGMDPSVATREGRASGFPFTVRTFPWIIAGHEIHHRKVLAERYL